MTNNTLTAVPGFKVGQITDLEGITGCTVILCPEGTVGGVDVRGGSPGTRETDLLRSEHQVQQIHAVVLSGGSAFGLAAADGVMRFLSEKKIGFTVPPDIIVPIVSQAILFDLAVGKSDQYPDASMGYQACENASTAPVLQGSVGAGTGCRVGSILGNDFAMKGGLGSASITFPSGLVIAAITAVNAIGDILAEDGTILAGVSSPEQPDQFLGTLNIMGQMAQTPSRENTVIGAVATNARLTKEGANKVASMAHDGLARAVQPAHTMFDGDTIFALASGQIEADVSFIGAFAAEVFAKAIRNAVIHATSLGGIRALGDR